VSTAEKAELARANGCDHVVVGYGEEAVLRTVGEVTDGQGVALACDSVGLATMDTSIAATRKRGTIASFGSASGPARPITLGQYFGRALMFTMPNVAAFNEGDELFRNAAELFGAVEDGLAAHIHARVPLAEAARAHALMEGRGSAGSIVLV
jgi:NADPH2:quinone reductase